jgi:pimeloyl-ACP methyl ester carboxylesterase
MKRALSSLVALLALMAVVPAAAAPISHFVEGAGGVRLHYLDFGGRGEPIILLAGLGNTAWIYGDFGARLTRDHRVLALTRRGHGESGQPKEGYDLDTLVEDIRRLMDSEGIKRAHLIGHSLAGAELTRFATLHPDRVGTLVYLDAAYDWSAEKPVDEGDPIAAPEPGPADRQSAPAYLDYVRRTRPDLARYWRPVVERDLAESIDTGADGTVRWRTLDVTFGALLAGANASPPNYHGVRAPAVALFANEDESYRLPANASPALRRALADYQAGPLARWRSLSEDEFRRGVAHGELIDIDSGHHLFLHHPDRVFGLVDAFLARHRIGAERR